MDGKAATTGSVSHSSHQGNNDDIRRAGNLLLAEAVFDRKGVLLTPFKAVFLMELMARLHSSEASCINTTATIDGSG